MRISARSNNSYCEKSLIQILIQKKKNFFFITNIQRIIKKTRFMIYLLK